LRPLHRQRHAGREDRVEERRRVADEKIARAGVRAAGGEVDALHPAAHEMDRVVVLVLDDEYAQAHARAS